jgi:hypothetical protein
MKRKYVKRAANISLLVLCVFGSGLMICHQVDVQTQSKNNNDAFYECVDVKLHQFGLCLVEHGYDIIEPLFSTK